MQGAEDLVELCRSKGLRITPQRLAVFRVLAENDGHLSVEEVWDKVRAGLPTVSPQTIMIFAPHDAAERAIVASLIHAAELYARGREMPPA